MLGDDEVYLQYNCARSLLYLCIDSVTQPELYSYVKRFEQMSDSINRIKRRTEIDDIHREHEMELQQRELSERHRRSLYNMQLTLVCIVAAIVIASLSIEQRRKQHYLRLQQELQRNQARIYKMYESIEAKRDNGTLERAPMLALYRANLTASVTLWHKEEWASRLRKLSEQRSKDIPSFTVKEREQLAEALERCFVTVITNLRDEAMRSGSKLSTEDIHLFLYLALGYSTGVIRECLAASSDNVVNQRKKRLSSKLPADIFSIFA